MPTPRKSIDPTFITDLNCPICGQDALSLKSLANYPDFVTCSKCDSQFAVEQEGDRIMYGKIPATYPRTRRFALQQWAWPEAIARRAADERPDSPIEPTGPTMEAPPPVTPDVEQPAEMDTAEPNLPAPADLEPHELTDEPTPIEPASASLDEPLRAEFSPTAEPPASGTPAAELDSEEPLLEAPEEDVEDLSTPEGLEPAATAADASPAPPDSTELEEDFLTELPEEFGEETTDFSSEATDIGDRLPAADQVEEEADSELDEPPAAADLFEDTAEAGPPIAPESELQDETFLEEFAEEPEAEAPLPSDWASAAEQPEALPEADEEDFLAEMQQAELEADLSAFDEPDEPALPDDWDEAEDDIEGIFTPPFGEGEPEETDDMPEDFEPAPPMPNWLNQSDPITESDAGDDEDLDAIDFTGLRDDIEEEPADTSFGQEEDLLASLWGDEEEDEFDFSDSDEAELGVDDDLAGFAGLGAISDEPEETGQNFADEAADLWAQEPEAEETDATVESFEAAPELPPKEAEQRQQIARAQWAGDQPEAEPEMEPIPELDQTGEDGEPVSLEAEEPPPGERYRVVLQKHEAAFPEEICAHCSQSPTVAKLSIAASVYRGTGIGERQTVSYRVPVCAECRDRAKARSDERQTAQLQAHLISVLVALILVVSALAFRLVDFQERIGVDLAILLLLAGMGYAIPVAFLLIRASRIGKPADAKYVETTLRVPGDTEGAETAFEFRSQRYAQYFHQKNEEEAVSRVNKVRERQYEQVIT